MMDEFWFSSFDVDSTDKLLKDKHALDIRDFLFEFKTFVIDVEKIIRIYDRCELPLLRTVLRVYDDTVVVSLLMSLCSDKYRSVMRRRVGLNAIELLPKLVKYSVSIDKIDLYIHAPDFNKT